MPLVILLAVGAGVAIAGRIGYSVFAGLISAISDGLEASDAPDFE